MNAGSNYVITPTELDIIAANFPAMLTRNAKSKSHLPLVVFLLLFPSSGKAQQSYRSYEELSGRVLKSTEQPVSKASARGAPMRFRGWNYRDKSRSDYLAHFTRPRTRAARAELLQNVARSAARQTFFGSPQFSPSQLPGILLRDSLPAGFIPTAIACGDFNGDGNLDFVVANGGDNTLWLYFGNGNGTFNLPTIVPVTLGQSPVWIATGDLRGIGRTDIVVAEADSNSVGVFLNSGNGTFAESVVALPDAATFLLVADFNNDGKLDIVAPMNDDNSNVYIAMLPGAGNGTFGSPVITPLDGYTPEIFWASSADLNDDGFPDLVLTSSQQDISIQVYLNNQKGGFSPGQVVAQNYDTEVNLGSVLFDANGDGKTDVLVADSFGFLWVYDGNGDGTFNTSNPGDFGIGDVGYGIVAADVNGDGILDVVVSGAWLGDLGLYGTQAGDQICVLLGDGKGNFSVPTVYRGDSSSYSLVVDNFTKNGLPDVVTANQDNDSVTVFLNNGSGGFGVPSGTWVGYENGGAVNAPMSGVLTADIDGNGTTDVAFMEWPPNGSNNYQLTALLNDGSGNLSPPVRSDATNFLVGDWTLADFRNTGRPDFLAISENYNSNPPNSYSFAPNLGGGSFGPFTETNSPNANGVLGVGDLNGDGKLDFVAAGYGINNQSLNGIAVFLGNGDGTFRTGYSANFGNATEPVPVAVYVGDFNRDGKLDLLVLLEGNGGILDNADLYEFLGNGDGTFQPGKLLIPNIGPMVVADVNEDGHPDIVSMATPNVSPFGGAPTPSQFSVYIGQPDGTFLLTNTYAPYVGGSVFAEQTYPPIYGKYTPMLADFNGDGILDIAAFQQYGANYTGTANADTFVQFLLGNGDGTFTPTYGVFDFRKSFVTAYAADLVGTGRAELFELNGYRSTYNILPNIVAPAFQFALLEDPVPPTQGSGIILLDVPAATATTVNLTSSDPAIQVPSTVTVPAGTISQTFTFKVGAAFNSQHGFAITAQSGSRSVTAIGTVSGTATFQTAGAMTISLAAGQTDSSLGQIITSVNGYSGTVSMQCLGLSAVGQCTFTPNSLTVHPGQISDGSMSFAALPNVAQGTYSGTLQTTDGATTQTSPITINIGDYTMSLSPQTLQLLPGGSGAYQLTVGSINQFNQIVNLTCSGLPAGATCSPNPAWTRPPTGANPVPIQVQLQSVPAGNYTITISGSNPPVTHTATAQLQVSDFTASVTPTTATVKAGGSTTFNGTVSPLNGFNGNVSFSCSTSSPLVSCAFNPSSGIVPASGTLVSVLTISASSQAASRRKSSEVSDVLLGLLAIGLPLSLLVVGAQCKRNKIAIVSLTFVMCCIVSCGGGSATVGAGNGGGGGGGGGNSQTYSITLQVSSTADGSTETKMAGTITLTVQ